MGQRGHQSESWSTGVMECCSPDTHYSLLHHSNALLRLTAGAASPTVRRWHRSRLCSVWKNSPAKARALSIVYAASIALMMGVNFLRGRSAGAQPSPFQVSDAQLSWIMTVFTAPAIVLSPIFGVIADLHGRRLLLALGMIAFGIFGAAMAFAPSFGWLLFFRTLQGVAFAAVIPLTIVLIGDLLEGDNEISGQGLKVFLDRIGYLVFRRSAACSR